MLLTILCCGSTWQADDSVQSFADSDNFWSQLTDSFALDHYSYMPQVQREIRWWRANPEYLNKILNNATPYIYFIFQQTQADHLPGELALIPVIESEYDPFAYSKRGAAGLWQLMPQTANGFGLKQDWWYDGRRDVYSSTKVALEYLKNLHSFFNGNWLLAIAAYDSGAGNIQDAVKHNLEQHRSTELWYLDLSNETRIYVPKLLALAIIISHPSRYGVTLPYVNNHPYFTEVNFKHTINLPDAAKAVNMSLKSLYQLNPGYNRFATDPKGPHRLLIPVNKVAIFKQHLNELERHHSNAIHTYHVQSGDSLSKIANEFGSNIIAIKNINHLKSDVIYTGQKLAIPSNGLAKKTLSSLIRPQYRRNMSKSPVKIVHTVARNESISEIAAHYHVKPTAIMDWNHLELHHALQRGQDLVLFVSPRYAVEHRHTATVENT